MSNRFPDQKTIKKLNTKELQNLSSEIRSFLIEKVAEKGGHLASNLGTVELTLALFSVFDFPKDKVIFDVGHQSYTYKLLTGREKDFDSLRDFNGMSGFPKRHESAYDAFDTGHSSTSISAGLGLVKARDLKGEDFQVISVIGDGSLSGGMALEGLNNTSQNKTGFIIILNDNEMSISRNVGGLSSYLDTIRSAKGYNRAKADVKKALTEIPGGNRLVQKISNTKDSLKEIVLPSGMLFENMGVTYLGPVDGHDISKLKRILKRAKELKRPVLIHVMTRKGKGYLPAEKKPNKFHGVNPFVVETGEPKNPNKGHTYSDIFARFMVQEGKKNPSLVGITAAMAENVGLDHFEKRFPDRFFDVGIAEGHAVTFAAGLAVGGMHPVVAIFSSFLQRSYDQILHDVCMQDLPVVLAIDRAGLVGKDGETHQGVFDLAFLRSMPNMTVMAPKNADELSKMLSFAMNCHHPVAVRYPRGTAYTGLSDCHEPIIYGKAEMIVRESEVAILALGNMVESAMQVHEKLKEAGIHSTVVNMRFVKPFDEELVLSLTEDHALFVTMEDGVKQGGFGEMVNAFLQEKNKQVQVENIAVPDEFVPQGSVAELQKMLHMDTDSVTALILNRML